jgi:uncharacterized membrane protein
MPDPVDPIDPIASNPAPDYTGAVPPHPTSTGLPSNVAAALACFPLIGGIIFFVLEKRDSFVRFYAMQSIIFGIAWGLFQFICLVVSAVLSHIPLLGPIFGFLLAIIWGLATIAFLAVLIVAILKAFSGVRWDIPWIGPMARRQVDVTF